MNERFNILSIDWDFFMKTEAEDSILFPDGGNENLPYIIQYSIWTSHYLEKNSIGGRRLRDIQVDSKEVQFVKKVIEKQMDPMCMITDSHKHIYNFIKDVMSCEGYDTMNLVNVDFHHDVYSHMGDDVVDCGNWMKKIIDEYEGTNSIFTWVNRENSDVDDMGWEGDRISQTKNLGIISEYDWDAIFICKSGMWSAPHLDKKFISTFQWMLDFFYVEYQSDVFKDRMIEIETMIEDMEKKMEKVI